MVSTQLVTTFIFSWAQAARVICNIPSPEAHSQQQKRAPVSFLLWLVWRQKKLVKKLCILCIHQSAASCCTGVAQTHHVGDTIPTPYIFSHWYLQASRQLLYKVQRNEHTFKVNAFICTWQMHIFRQSLVCPTKLPYPAGCLKTCHNNSEHILHLKDLAYM